MNKIYHCKCKAKINLFLHVLSKLDTGYHSLDSMVMFTDDLYDEMSIEYASENKINISGKYTGLDEDNNILYKVIDIFEDCIYNTKFKINLNKNIPVSAGLGGGSSDAAELIKFILKEFSPKIEVHEIINRALSIGADVPMFLYKKSLYFNGIGEVISPFSMCFDIFALIVSPNFCISTEEVFKSYEKEISKREVNHILQFNDKKSLLDFLNNTENDLFEYTLKFSPQIAKIIFAIKASDGCMTSRMSGTGATCFGLFFDKDKADAALRILKKQFSEYFICVTGLK